MSDASARAMIMASTSFLVIQSITFVTQLDKFRSLIALAQYIIQIVPAVYTILICIVAITDGSSVQISNKYLRVAYYFKPFVSIDSDIALLWQISPFLYSCYLWYNADGLVEK